jgi:hypothetical protein
MDKNARVLNIIQENFGNYKEDANQLLKFDKDIQQKLRTISTKLIPFIIQNCKEEYNNLITKFKIVESSQYGSQILPLNKDEADMSLLNKVERCVDRYTGINKLITMYEIDSRNTLVNDDQCKRHCIKDSNNMTDKELMNCLSCCYETYYSESLQLAGDFESNLNKINLNL